MGQTCTGDSEQRLARHDASPDLGAPTVGRFSDSIVPKYTGIFAGVWREDAGRACAQVQGNGCSGADRHVSVIDVSHHCHPLFRQRRRAVQGG